MKGLVKLFEGDTRVTDAVTELLESEGYTVSRYPSDGAKRPSERFFRHALDMLCIAGYDGYFKVLNPSWSRTLGYSDEELLATPWIEFVHPDDRDATEKVRSVLVDGQEIYRFENRYICKDGTVRWLSWNSFPYPDDGIMFGVARDVTVAKQNEQRMQELVAQNGLLLAELRHRVKNNLNIVAGLIELEAGDIESGVAHEALLNARARLRAVAAMYDRFNFADEGGEIDLSAYLKDLSTQVFSAYSGAGIQLELKTPSAGPLVESQRAMHIGFIVNELVANAVKHAYPKHAYPHEPGGRISVHLDTDSDTVRVCVKDEGVGLPREFEFSKAQSTGMSVIRALAEQLNAELRFESEQGTAVSVLFPRTWQTAR